MAYQSYPAGPNFPSNEASGKVLAYDEFLRWPGDNQDVEWVDGRVVPISPVTKAHAVIHGFLYSLLTSFAEIRHLGQVYGLPFQMKTGPDLPGRAPDIFFVSNQNHERVRLLYLEGPADLVVEIISPGSRATDRGDKFYEYEQGGVPEYWLIDPDRKQAEFYIRGQDGIYRLVSVGPGGIYHSKMMPGLWIKVAWLWETLPPPIPDVLREWKLI
ncbi:MAG: hypothetical protein C5B50_20235 [Verrucomicrobia bacterium]|nr:MAG: hypothetical protein C5B50_20235 [Verrucomicrobiota bacterium]